MNSDPFSEGVYKRQCLSIKTYTAGAPVVESYNTAVVVVVVVLVVVSLCCCCGLVSVGIIAAGLFIANEKKLNSFTNIENQND